VQPNVLEGRIALITGAGAGIGAATADLFAAEGATVIVADIDEAAAQAVAKAIQGDGGSAAALAVDVRNADEIFAMRDAVLAEHGRLDILVNNVGHWVALPASFAESGPEHWQALYEVNLLHVLLASRAFLPSMIERRRGCILNVSSIEGMRGYPQDTVYGALKAAVIQFTKSLAIEVAGYGVKVNGIAPDLTQSAQSDFAAIDPPEWSDQWWRWLPLGRVGQPIDQAKALLFLASDLSDFLVGHTIPTDGGTGAAAGWYRSDKRAGRRWTNRPQDA
jgi:NAD(P)-dependent dehydrogenase (short-subunit alcohol dehydrogenase family)